MSKKLSKNPAKRLETSSKPQVSLIVTLLNEAQSIELLLESIANQKTKPNQTILVDGGSTDNTFAIIQNFAKKHPELKIEIYRKKSNRSQGRNYAVLKAKYSLIAITDGGCILKSDWLEELLKTYQKTKSPLIAGYYQAQIKTIFHQAVTPYLLVMPDKIDPNNFLPATRSMLVEKKLWNRLGGLNPKLNFSEDYDFAHRAKKLLDNERRARSGGESLPNSEKESRNGTGREKIEFNQKAVVFWQPPSSPSEFYKVASAMAGFDKKANLMRFKAKLVMARYAVFGLLLLTMLLTKSWWMGWVLISLIAAYVLWIITKHGLESNLKLNFYRVLIQLLADWGIVGTV